jgi:hypothetical protein
MNIEAKATVENFNLFVTAEKGEANLMLRLIAFA